MIRPDLTLLPSYIPGATLPNALKLASNESSTPPLDSVVRVLTDATTSLNRYPDMSAHELRARLAEFVQPGLSWENIAVGNGSSALCLQSVQATCTAGDEVIFAWRSFEAYPILTRIAGASPVMIPLTKDLRHDLSAMAAAVTDKTKLIFVCNPNNPTGTTITREEFSTFLQAVPRSVHVVLDEAYLEYNQASDGPLSEYQQPDGTTDMLSLFSDHPNVAVCRTFSKAYGLAGLRLGYMVGPVDFIEAINKVGIPFGVNKLAQVAGVASINAQGELQERVVNTVAQRQRILEALGSRSVPSQANFVWLPIGDKSSELDAALKQEGIVARCFPGEGVRVTVSTEEETDILLPALERALTAVGL